MGPGLGRRHGVSWLSAERRSSSFVPLREIIGHAKKTNDWSNAIEAADMLLERTKSEEKGSRLSPFLMTDLIRIYGNGGNLGKAISLLYEMKLLGVTPNEHHFGALLQSCRKASQWEMSLELFSRMDDYKVRGIGESLAPFITPLLTD